MSELKSILLHLDAAANGAARLQWARRLAQGHGAHLDEMYAVLPAVLQYPFAFTADGAGATLLMNYEAEQRQRIQAAFELERQRGPQPDAMSWFEAEDEPVRAFTERAWGADLLVLAQANPDPKRYAGVPPDFAAAVLLHSGKPGVVLPSAGAGGAGEVGKQVLVAWKPTPESARAVSAALPILQRARQVHVAVWDEPGASGAASAEVLVEPFLRRHGISVKVHRGGPPTHELGELLLSLAADVQADLLVMGCYGHGRAREWALGGVTRTVLRSMTLPVFMTH